MKKVLSVIIALILLISSMPMTAIAADETALADTGGNFVNGDVGDLKWKLDMISGVLLIYGSGELPEYIFYKPPWYEYRHDIKTISLSEGVLDITPWLFCSERDNLKYSYDKLETLILSKTVTSISGSSFTNCINLRHIDNIPSSLVFIGPYAFCNCSLNGALDLSPLETIGSSAFEDNINLTEVVFSDNLREVDTCAFLDCGLTSVSFGPSIEELGDYSFGFKEVKSYYTGETVKEKIPGFTIYGYEDTEAEVYANKYGFTFVSLNEIHSVNVTITEPEGGNKPSYSVTLPAGASYKQYNVTGADMINGVTWYYYDNLEHVRMTDNFEAGKKYIVSIRLCPKSDIYRFADDVEYTVNGSSSGAPASIESDEIELICTFTAGPEKIYNVDVSGIVPPVGGKQPSYKATIPADKGYKLDTYSDDEQENGVVWVSDDSQKTMKKTDTFMTGRKYTAAVYLYRVSDAYVFSPDASGTINGMQANNPRVFNNLLGEGFYFRMSYTFTATDKEQLSSFTVTGVTAPKPGESPSYNALLPLNAGYTWDSQYNNNTTIKKGVAWMDEDGDYLNAGSKFESGRSYTVWICLKPSSDYEFAVSGLSGTVNGKKAGIEVLEPKTSLVLSYTFFCSSGGTVISGGSISGTVTSFLDDNDKVTLKLYKVSLGSFDQPASVQYIYGNSGTYKFSGLTLSGLYRLEVSKDNHVTRFYSVIAKSGAQQDAKIHPFGDLDGDGNTSTFDYAQCNAHAKGVKTITDEYILACANVAGGDDEVTTLDAAAINAHAKGVKLLWK